MVRNIIGKGENAGNAQCFQRASGLFGKGLTFFNDFKFYDMVRNIIGKGENAGNAQCFQRASGLFGKGLTFFTQYQMHVTDQR